MPRVLQLAMASAAFAGVVHAAVPAASHVDPAVMAKAFPASGVPDQAALDGPTRQARDLVAKSLGDDARDLVFVPITPCTVWDTRFATDPNSMGAVGNAVTRKFYTHLDGAGGSYASWGGNPSCPETAQNAIGLRPFAAMMTAYVNDATANGWVTFYRDGDADPSLATISVYYSPGPTRTQTVIAKSSRGYGSGTYDVAVTGRFASANVSASVVGYFVKPVNIVLPTSTATTGNVMKGATRFLHNFGTRNVFLGTEAGNFTLSAPVGIGDNSGFGYQALKDLTTGGSNTAMGSGALANATTGTNNVAVGSSALFNLQTGVANVAIGQGAGFFTTGDNNIYIGHDGSGADDDTIRVGSSSHTRTFIHGIRGRTTGNANAIPVLIDSAGQLGTVSSSREVKDDIADMDHASEALMKLRPVTFHYRQHGPGAPLQYGLVAEEVEQVYPELVAKTNDGKTETVMYQFLPPMLLNEYQKQQKRIEAQDAEIAGLKADMAELREALKRLR